MKNFTKTFVLLSFVIFFSCNSQDIAETEITGDPNFRVIENNSRSLSDPCLIKDLIVGQNQNTPGGTVSVATDGVDILITYDVTSDWTITETHMSIGDCVQTIPINGGGNPKVGHFEHGSSHSNVSQVTYLVSRTALPVDIYCFAAHAKVSSANGNESAWAEGITFEGNNWGMFNQESIAECDAFGGGGGGGGED